MTEAGVRGTGVGWGAPGAVVWLTGLMRVTTVACRQDNYAYVLSAPEGREAVVVDPSDATPVVRACVEAGLEPVAVLNTHHHHDHVAGNEELQRRYAEIRVMAHEVDRDRVPGLTDTVRHGQQIAIAGLELHVLHVPGHTRGGVTYVVEGAAFTGDTLFAAGCGRLLEGTARELHRSLNEVLARLPGATRIFCGHEYTVKNLEFARRVEPRNESVIRRLATARAQRAQRESTLPTTIGDELATNPFLRTASAELRSRLSPELPPDASDEQVFAALRAARNRF